MWFRGFRIGDVDGTHSSISHKNGWTAQIWRSDATVHPGPRQDYHARYVQTRLPTLLAPNEWCIWSGTGSIMEQEQHYCYEH